MHTASHFLCQLRLVVAPSSTISLIVSPLFNSIPISSSFLHYTHLCPISALSLLVDIFSQIIEIGFVLAKVDQLAFSTDSAVSTKYSTYNTTLLQYECLRNTRYTSYSVFKSLKFLSRFFLNLTPNSATTSLPPYLMAFRQFLTSINYFTSASISVLYDTLPPNILYQVC